MKLLPYDVRVQASRNRYSDAFLDKLPSSDSPYYSFLYHMTTHILHYKKLNGLVPSCSVLILGVYRGVDMAHIASAMDAYSASNDVQNLDIVGIDIEKTEEAEKIAEKFSEYIDYISGVSSVSEEVFKELKDVYGDDGFDMIFFDSLHDSNHVEQELNLWLPLAKDGCVLAFDDVNLGDIHLVAKEVSGEYIELNHLHTTHGFGVVVYDKKS